MSDTTTPSSQTDPRLDLIALKLSCYVAESAILVATAHKILNVVRQSLGAINDSAEADYLLARIADWNRNTSTFAAEYGQIGTDISNLKKLVSN